MGFPKTNNAKQKSTKVYINNDNYSSNEYLPGFGIATDNIENKKSLIEFLESTIGSIDGVDNMNTDLARGLIGAWNYSGGPRIRTHKGKLEKMGPTFQYGKNGPIIDVSGGDIVGFLGELAHAKQYQHAKTQKIITILNQRALDEQKGADILYGKNSLEVYRHPGLVEYNAHSIYEPYIRKKFAEESGFGSVSGVHNNTKRRYGAPIHPGTPDY